MSQGITVCPEDLLHNKIVKKNQQKQNKTEGNTQIHTSISNIMKFDCRKNIKPLPKSFGQKINPTAKNRIILGSQLTSKLN